jgi:hypothetical protein
VRHPRRGSPGRQGTSAHAKAAFVAVHPVTAAIKGASNGSNLAALRSGQPLRQSLWVLQMAADAGLTAPISIDDIQTVLEENEIAVSRIQLLRALSRAGRKVISKSAQGKRTYRIAIPGREYLTGRLDGTVEVIFVESGHKYSARKTVRDLATSLGGTLRVVDRYYGERSLEILEELARGGRQIRFLTCQTPEKPGKVNKMVHELCREYPSIEVKLLADARAIHDRYVLGDDAFLIVGQGIKDLGHSESFVIRLDRSTGANLIELLKATFDSRWQVAGPVP